MLESFRSNIERQGLQYQQYLKLLGKEQSAFEEEIRTEAEVRVRRSLVLDAFATAEQIDSGDEAGADQQAEARSTRALERLVDLATGDARNGSQAETSEMTADAAETPDTGDHTRDADAPATPEAQEERGTA